VGTRTNEQLKAQQDQISSIHDDVVQIEDGLTRADKLIR